VYRNLASLCLWGRAAQLFGKWPMGTRFDELRGFGESGVDAFISRKHRSDGDLSN
jgi:hypothetical protein